MSHLTDRFLSAFGRIEARLHALSPRHTDSFNDVVTDLARRNAIVREKALELRQLASLRNFLSHKNQRQLATPVESIVRRAESLADLFDRPPPLLVTHFAMQVETCQSSDPIGTAAKVLYDHCFSQMPIVDGGRVVGLLTSETIARWIASKLATVDMLEEETVGAVQSHQDSGSKYIIVPKDYTVVDAFQRFDEHLKKGNDLEAILITHSGSPTEKLLGIATAADIPKMLSLLYGAAK